MQDFSFWDAVEIGVGQCVSWTVGKLALWAEHYEQEWHVLPLYDEGIAEKSSFSVRSKSEKPESTEWNHYLLKDGSWVYPLPVMMDRPVLIRPDRTLVLLSGEQARFYVALPLWLSLRVGGKEKASTAKKLNAFPILPMVNAWFGDPVSGELCYFTATRLYPGLEQIPFSSYHAICSLSIKNDSEKDLPFDRLCLHTEFLNIYQGLTRFWTNDVSVVYKGIDQGTQVVPSKGAPALDGSSHLIASSRQPIENWYIKRTFNLLKYFTGF
ncbi:hypothetical protein MASR2M78_14320 [Treponema sp.]